MPEAGVPHTGDTNEKSNPPQTNGETRPKEETEQRARERQEDQRRREVERREAKHAGEKEEKGAVKKHPKPQVEIPFKDASAAAKIIRAIQDEQQVVVNAADFESLKRVLLKAGHTLKEVEEMSQAQIVVLAQKALGENRVSNPEEGGVEEALALRQIEIAKSEGEEILSEGKVAGHLRVEDVSSREATPEVDHKREEKPIPVTEKLDAQAKQIVTSYPHLWNTKREDVLKILAEQGIDVAIPDSWDKWGVYGRQSWLSQRKIISFTQIPESEFPRIAGGQDIEEDEGEARRFSDKQKFSIAFWELRRLVDQGADDPSHPEHDHWLAQKGVLDGFIKEVDDAAVRKTNYRRVSRIVEWVSDLHNRAELGKTLATTEEFLPKATKDRIYKIQQDLDSESQKQFDSLGTKERELLFGRLEADIADAKIGFDQRFRFPTLDHVEAYIFGNILPSYVNENEDFAPLMEWRAEKLFEEIQKSEFEAIQRRPPVDWRDSVKHVGTLFRLIERTSASLDQVSQAIQETRAITRSISLEKLDPAEAKQAEAIKLYLNNVIDAVESVTKTWIVNEDNSMDPRKTLETFSPWNDRTMEFFFKRFDQDHEGRQFEDKDGKVFNLLEKALGAPMDRMAKESIKMMAIEEWTINDLDFEIKDADPIGWDKKRIILKMVLTRKEFLSLNLANPTEIDSAYASLSPDQRARAQDIWYDIDKKKGAISEWYRNNLLLGAMGPDSNGVDLVAKRKGELLEDLKRKLGELGLDGNRIKELEDVALLSQVNNLAYRFCWNFALSEYDGIRIWDPNRKLPNRRGGWGAYVYNQNSNLWYGRVIDHALQLFIDEGRGKPTQTNAILEEYMPGRNGNVLPQNRHMVRFARQIFGEREETQAAIKAKIAQWQRSKSKAIEALDMSDPYDKKWLEDAAYAELIEEGQINFKDVEWSRLEWSVGAHASKYSLLDLYTDRITAYQFIFDGLQQYLPTPETKRFFEMNDFVKSFSKREPRVQPWMKLAIPAHVEMGKHWKKWFKLPYNMASREAEAVIESAVQNDMLSAEKEGWMKRKYLGHLKLPGIWIVRRPYQYWEGFKILGKETGKSVPFLFLLFLWELLKGMFSQSEAQVAGK